MVKLLCCALLCFIVSGTAYGQAPKYPFPQNVKYPYGVMPTKQDTLSKHAKKWYDNWKKKYLQECSGNLRPGVDPLSKSLVEAQGFSMVAVAYMGEKDVFDKLYNFYQGKCATNACGMMNWKVNCAGVEPGGSGSATDGDVDVACALIVANWQWPDGGYDEKAKAVITNLKKVVTKCSGVDALCGGCSGGNPWGGCNETDISYYEPAFFRYFAKLTGDDTWTKLADDTHTIRDAGANATTGLVPDWQTVSGTPGPNGRKGYFSFDAIRAPYKQTLDYLWNGNTKAQAWCKKISTWANGVGPKNIVDGYQLNGSAQGGTYRNIAVEGSLAVAAMANTQQVLDAFVTEALVKKDESWYCGYLGNLYYLALSGNIWNPDIIDGVAGSVHRPRQNGYEIAPLSIKVSASGRITVAGLPRGSAVTLATLDGRIILKVMVLSDNEPLSLNTPMVGRGCHVLRIVSGNNHVVRGRIVSLL